MRRRLRGRAGSGLGCGPGSGFRRRLCRRLGRRFRSRLCRRLGRGLRRRSRRRSLGCGLGLRGRCGSLGRNRLSCGRFGRSLWRKREVRIRRQEIVQGFLGRFPLRRHLDSIGGRRSGRQHRIAHIRHERRQIRIQSGFDVVIRGRTPGRRRDAAAHIAQQSFHLIAGGSRRGRCSRCGRRGAAHIAQQILYALAGRGRRRGFGLGGRSGGRRHFDARGRQEILHRAVQRGPLFHRGGRRRMRLAGDIQMVQQSVHIVYAGHDDLLVGIFIRALRRGVRPGETGGAQLLHGFRRALPHLLQQAVDGIA